MASLPVSDNRIVSRCYDAAAINAVCNHPAVLPGLSLGLHALDVSDLLEDRRNIAFLGEYGGALFHRTGPGVYAAHDFFLPQGRGQWALAASRKMLAKMFDQFAARLIWAETPVENRACRMFNRWLGFKSEGVTTAALYPGAEPSQIETFVMEAVCL
ncbi:hypothetical protein [Sphingomonas sp. MA1305]|uniref:hypothetical protein n=1 Tax=Sphingomonas sp. MA1305 TaxID=2479204 RepID=UPI0018DF4C21|nr:hypothetical protein [Sphingomonas sp. MA1305]